jgi:predicted ATPase/DNA-binding SARP family transcriptional activator
LLALAPSYRLHRESLIETLWPDLDGVTAANNLRVALSRARRRLEAAGAPPGKFLVRDGEHYVLAQPDAVRVDLEDFAAAVARAWATEDPAAARAALDRYSGDLLPEDPYEDWAANRRHAVRTSYLTLLARLAQLHEQRGELGRAIAAWQRIVSAEPSDESAHAALIGLFARVGETRQALTQYDRLVTLLADELGTEPTAATRDLARAIREGRFPSETQRFAPDPAAGSLPTARPDDAPHAGRRGLPLPLDELVGRTREVAELRRLLATRRLVTLTGPAGVGKTRLALAVAAGGGERSGSALFVDLAPLRDPNLVLPSIARMLGVREEGSQSIGDAVAAHIGDSPLLLVLDNFEQVAGAAAAAADVLASCPKLAMLVTSRRRLRVRGEQEYPVQPLAVPGKSEEAAAIEKLADVPAVALFVLRAQAAWPDFELTVGNAEAVAAICRRLDGLPLAIELAAARAPVLAPAALLARLDRLLAMLTGGPQDAPVRQQTLRAAIGWSHDLLAPAEQTLFARLAVFAGGFTVQAAEAIGRVRGEATLHPNSVLDLVSSLAEQSLLRRAAGTDDDPRFTMLETIREYALERLAASGDAAAVQARHAAFFLDLAEQAAPELTGADSAVWMNRLDAEHDNLRATLATLSQNGNPLGELRLAGALWRFWWLRGHLGEGRAHLERALEEGSFAPGDVRANAWDGAGTLAAAQGDLDRAAAWHSEALRLWRDAGDHAGMVRALTNLGLAADEQGDPRRATALLQEALVLARETADRRGIAVVLANLGQVALTLEDHERAAPCFAESAAIFRELGDRRDEAAILANLGVLALLLGDFGRAATCHEEALALLRGLGDRQGEADELLNLGHAVQRQGDLERAAALFAEARARFEQLGDRGGNAFALIHLGKLAGLQRDADEAEELLKQGLALGEEIDDRVAIVEALEGLAMVACARGEALRCGRLIGAAEGLREAIGVPLPRIHQADVHRCLTAARRALGDAACAAARTSGRELIAASMPTPRLAILAGDEPVPAVSASGAS